MINIVKVTDDMKKEIEESIKIWADYIADKEFDINFLENLSKHSINSCLSFKSQLYSKENENRKNAGNEIQNDIWFNEEETIRKSDIQSMKNRIHHICEGIAEKFIDVYRDINLNENKIFVIISIKLYSIDSDSIKVYKKSHSLNTKIEFDYDKKTYSISDYKWFVKDIFTDEDIIERMMQMKQKDKDTVNEEVKNILKKTKKNKSLLMNSSKMNKIFSIENHIISRFLDELILDDHFMKFNDEIDVVCIEHNDLYVSSKLLLALNDKLSRLNLIKIQPLSFYLRKNGEVIIKFIDLTSMNFNEEFIYYICEVSKKDIDPIKHNLRRLAGIVSDFKPKVDSTAIKIKDNKITMDVYDLISLMSGDKYNKPRKYLDYQKLSIVEK